MENSRFKFREWDMSSGDGFMSFSENWTCLFNKAFIGDDIIMQYTSCKDKNKKDIYESDLLKVKLNEECTKVFEVFFDNGKFQARGYNCYKQKELLAIYDLCTLLHESEVIGNIYENPELLKGE